MCFILVLSLFPVQLFAAAPFYEGKVIKMLVGHEVGGGYDKVARIMAQYLPKYIPGKPTLFVENMVGGGSVVATNYLYNISKPDGLTIGMPDRGLPFAQLLKAEGLQFDLRKFLWLGSPFADAFLLSIRGDLPYKTYADLLKAKTPIFVGSSGPTTTDYQYPALLKEYTGLNCNIVIYKSGAASNLAVERKEVDGKAASYSAVLALIQRGLLRPVVRGRTAPSETRPEIVNLPLDENLAASKTGKTILAMFSSVNQVGRCFIMPPGTPPELVAIIRAAFAKACEDPALKDTFAKLSFPGSYIHPEEAIKMLNFVLDQPADVVKEFSKFIKF